MLEVPHEPPSRADAPVKMPSICRGKMGFYVQATYIDTHANHLADDLSRNNLHSFLFKVSNADPWPTPLPGQLLDLLLEPAADWTSLLRSNRFRATIRMA